MAEDAVKNDVSGLVQAAIPKAVLTTIVGVQPTIAVVNGQKRHSVCDDGNRRAILGQAIVFTSVLSITIG